MLYVELSDLLPDCVHETLTSCVVSIVSPQFPIAYVVVPNGYPRIVESPSLKAVEKDRSTVMVCAASGTPEPTIMWLKDFIPVDTTDPRVKLQPTGECYNRQFPLMTTIDLRHVLAARVLYMQTAACVLTLHMRRI
jgi:hypothetical protein